MTLADIQDSIDVRGVGIDEVGICDLRYPTTFQDEEIRQQGIGLFNVSVVLDARRRGTHMSRMVQFVNDDLGEFNPSDLPTHLKAARTLLGAETVRVRLSMPIGLPVVAPVSGLSSVQVHDVCIAATGSDSESVVVTTVTSDITSLCPCSKAVSDYGAHNQRSRVTASVEGLDGEPYPVSVSHIANLIRGVGSAPVMPLVKRIDERHLTMMAHDRPAFVEDIVRDLSLELRNLGVSHTVGSRNIESIHSHDASAQLRWHASVGGRAGTPKQKAEPYAE